MEDEREVKPLKVGALIDRATTSTMSEVDPRLLKAIKFVVRYSDSELRLAVQTLFDLMKRDHAQIRYLALLIIDQLFMRSKLFRTLVVENMDMLLALSVGFRKNQPLPAPPSVATLLRSKAIEFLEKWNGSFGVHHKQLRLGFDYLKNTLRFQFPNLQANAARIQKEMEERDRRSRKILLSKFKALKQNFASVKEEIKSAVQEIEECLEIARSSDERASLGSFDEEDFMEIRCSELRQIRVSALEEGEKVHENNENKVVFDTLRELYKLVVTKHLVSAREWISLLVRVEVTDNKFRDSALKELIDIKNLLQSVKKECEEAVALQSNENKDEEEDFWEDGKIESFEIKSSNTQIKEEKDATVASTSRGKKVTEKKLLVPQANSLKGELLTEAPTVNWGPHLDDWGSKRDVLANHRGLELESHWGRVDYDALIPAEKIAELNVQATVYREDEVEIQPCRAPLRKGGFCSRRDLKVCPFHGLIIPRDSEGKPIDDQNLQNENTASERDEPPQDSTTSDSGVDLVEKLAKQAVKNVRERDKTAHLDKRAQKKARLAEVREHNVSVLRDAALASTSRSANIGEDLEAESVRSKFASRSEKQKLASMLRKKETAKNRISRRLLKRSAGEATVMQLTSSEDASYREAFPNQW